MPDVKTMRDLLVACVQDLHAAEQAAVDRYPPLVDAATAPELKAALEAHRAQSEEQALRLATIAKLLGESAKGPDCLWAKGILDDAKRDTKSVEPGPLLDAALIGALRKLENAEIVSYETALGAARALRHAEAERLLAETHAEERAMDARLAGMLGRALGGTPAGP